MIPTELDLLREGMERVLRGKGLMEGDRALVLQGWSEAGIRATLLEGKGKKTRTLATATMATPRGSLRDRRNGLCGALIARLNESKGGEP
jgi:hypothetical protein